MHYLPCWKWEFLPSAIALQYVSKHKRLKNTSESTVQLKLIDYEFVKG